MIRVLIVEDMELTRSALAALLRQVTDIDIVAEASTGPGIVSLAKVLIPDVVVINNDLTVSEQVPIVASLHATLPETAVLVLADPRKPFTLPVGRWAGAPSFLVKDVSPEVLVDTVRRLAAGERVIDQRIAIASLSGAEPVLTNREIEVLGLAADGASVVEIATRLYLSLGTVRNHISKVIGKTGARNRIDAIRIAREAGWIA